MGRERADGMGLRVSPPRLVKRFTNRLVCGHGRSRRHRRRGDGPVHRLPRRGARRAASPCSSAAAIGDPATASYGRTRSYRSDYLDAGYARLAHEAIRLWDEFERATGTERAGPLRLHEHRQALGHAGPRRHLRRSSATRCSTRLGLPTESLDARRAARRASPSSTPTSAASTPTPASSTSPAVTGALHARARRARACRSLEGVEPTAIERDGELLRVATDGGEFRTALARRHRRARHQRRARAAAGLHPAGARSPRTARARRSTSARRPDARRRSPSDVDAGDRLPRHRDLLPPDRRRAHRRGEDRLLQPAGHAAASAHRASTASRSSSSSACPACATRRSPDVRTSTSATTTSWPTTTSCSAPSRASPTPSSASAGAAPATSSRRGWAACWPSSRCRTAPSTTSAASTPPASTESRGDR